MKIIYKNSLNQDINIVIPDEYNLDEHCISYSDISFEKEYPHFLKIKNTVIEGYTKEEFLKNVEYNPIKKNSIEVDYMIFEINRLSEFINVILFYRFLDMLHKIIYINHNQNFKIDEILNIFYEYTYPSERNFLKYKNLILEGKIDLKDETKKLIDILNNYNHNNQLKSMFDVINAYLYNPTEVYYRGVGTPLYPEQPGIFRLRDGENETKIFKEMIVRYPNIFKGNNTIESLTHMQHYELKTRLLDITTNPLVALYMAVNKIYTNDPEQIEFGEVIVYFTDINSVKYYDSNKVLLNSKLIFLSKDEKDMLFMFIKKIESLGNKVLNQIQNIMWENERINYELIKKIRNLSQYLLNYNEINDALCAYYKLLSIVRQDIPSFVNRIELLGLLKSYIVKVGYINERISAQSGGFILFGLDKNYLARPSTRSDDIISSRTFNVFPRIIIKNKSILYDELNAIGINDSTMIPDIEHASKFIIDKYR